MPIAAAGVVKVVTKPILIFSAAIAGDANRTATAITAAIHLDILCLPYWVSPTIRARAATRLCAFDSTACAWRYSGLKGRYQESKIDDDQVLSDSTHPVPELQGDKIADTEISALTAINERLRLDYAKDSDRGIQRFNKIIREHRIDLN